MKSENLHRVATYCYGCLDGSYSSSLPIFSLPYVSRVCHLPFAIKNITTFSVTPTFLCKRVSHFKKRIHHLTAILIILVQEYEVSISLYDQLCYFSLSLAVSTVRTMHIPGHDFQFMLVIPIKGMDGNYLILPVAID